MPKVHPDQRNKFETEEFFKKLSQDCDVKYSGFKDKGHEERKQKFMQELHEGHAVVRALCDDRPPESRPSKEMVDFDREMGKVHMMSSFIMNGVCVKWIGWLDLEALSGKARLVFDEERARVEDDILRQVLKDTQERVRVLEESQKKWKEQHQQQAESPQMMMSS